MAYIEAAFGTERLRGLSGLTPKCHGPFLGEGAAATPPPYPTKGQPHRDPGDPPRRRANKRRGLGNWEGDRPPVFSVIARGSGEVRSFVRERADSATCLAVIETTVPRWAAILYTDALAAYVAVEDELHIWHASVRHGSPGGPHEWARDDDGDGIREVHCNRCEGAGAGLRTFLRTFRGVHKKYLKLYVACYETMANAKRITSAVLRRMCFGSRQPLTVCA
jgi:transposase-like protein